MPKNVKAILWPSLLYTVDRDKVAESYDVGKLQTALIESRIKPKWRYAPPSEGWL